MKFEVKKLVCKRIVYVIVVLSMLINGIYCFNSADKINSKKYKNASECQKNIYKKIEGKITQDKADFISTEYERLKKIIESGDYSKEYDETTYSGYIFLDYNIFKEIYDEFKYNVEYKTEAENICKKANECEKIYEIKNNKYFVEYYKNYSVIFSNRYIDEFYDTRGWDIYFKYSFSNLIIIMLIIFINCGIFCNEREEKMAVLIISTSKGKTHLIRNKIIAGVIVSLIIACAFYIEDFIIFMTVTNLHGFDNLIYSVRTFKMCPLNVSMLQFCIYIFICKITGIIVISSLVALASSMSDTNFVSSVLAVIFIIVLVIFNNIKIKTDILCLITPQLYLKEYDIVKIFNKPILKTNYNMICALLIVIAVYTAVWWLEAELGKAMKKERI